MEYKERKALMDKIICGSIFFKDLTFVPISPEQEARSILVYENELSKCKHDGMLTDEQCLQICILNGSWSVANEKIIKQTQKEIHDVIRSLIWCLSNFRRLESTRKVLRKLEKKIIDYMSKRQMLLLNTANSHATKCKNNYIIASITYKDNKLLWKILDDLDNCQNINLTKSIMDFYFYSSIIPIKDIRELARNDPWRSRWTCYKKMSKSPFANKYLSTNQENLIYWSTVYDNVYESYERPPKKVIFDDDLLDSWLINENEKYEKETNKLFMNKNIDKTNTNNHQKSGKTEVFIMADPDNVKEIYDMNHIESRVNIKKQQAMLEKNKNILEADTPSSRMHILQQIQEKRKNKNG